MCSRRWFRSVLYIAFPPPPPHPAAGKRMHVPTPHYAVRIDRHVIDTEDVWLVDGWYHVPFPVKLDFACFPQDVFCVEAHFEHNIFAKSEHPRYKALTDYLQPASDRYQQCMRFVYEANGVPPRELLLIRNEHRRRRH